MLISEYMQMRNITSAVTTGNSFANNNQTQGNIQAANSPFALELQKQLSQEKVNVDADELSRISSVQFSKHAVERINERQIDLYSDDRLGRLNKAVELAEEKGSNDALVFIDSTAFVVSVKNNKVITTVSADDIEGNIFTNIDSTVIM